MIGLRRATNMTGSALWGAAGALIYLDLFLGYEQFRTAWTILSPVGMFLWWLSDVLGRKDHAPSAPEGS